MANVINRAQYGNLSCLWAIYKSRFTSAGDSIPISNLKVSSSYGRNPYNVCEGASLAARQNPLPKGIAKFLGRDEYCPFLESRTDGRACQWVHSSDVYDSQKSKPAGQAAIALEIVGLGEIEMTSSGRAQSLRWTHAAHNLSTLSWGSSKVDEYLAENALFYGPLLGLAFRLLENAQSSVSSSDVRQDMMIRPSGDVVETKCSNGTVTEVGIWDGNTSSDAASRTTSALLSLSASVGLTRPSGFPASCALEPSAVARWYNTRAVEGNTSFPRKYYVQIGFLDNLFRSKPLVKRGIHYIHFVPKPTDRNKGNRCSCCKENVVNNARSQYGEISMNRRYLLLQALGRASDKDSMLNLEKLAKESVRHDGFYFDTSDHLKTLLNVERENAVFYGFPNRVVDTYLLEPLVRAESGSFGNPPSAVQHTVDKILSANLYV